MKRKMLLAAASFLLLCGLSFAQGPSYPYSVSLNFTASTGTVVSYNMYRAPYTTICGSFTKLTTTPFTGLTYVDNNPPQGSYCYAATALDSANRESGFSNIDSNIQIPPPPPTGLGATVGQVNGGNEVTFAWNQSSGTGVTSNKLFCKEAPAKKYSLILNVSAPIDELRLKQNPGYYTCGVTATSAAGQSGLSNTTSFHVN